VPGAPDESDGRDTGALDRRTRYNGWQAYLATTLREEGRLAAKLGDTVRAARAWEHYLAFRDDPEPRLVPGVDSIRAALDGLRGR
jgi:hypothetical protein